MNNHASIKENSPTISSLIVKRKSKAFPTPCKICGASALYSFFGVIACSPCKMFFKRNAQTKQNDLKCPYHGHCEINIINRHACASCRLAKCLACGMQVELIRALRSSTKNSNRNLVRLKQNHSSGQLTTLNLLQSDETKLTTDERNLISNLIHCFDEYSGFTFAQQFLQQQNQLHPKMRFKLAVVGQFYLAFLHGGKLFYEKNPDFISLCSHDRSILLQNTMKYVASVSTCFILRHTRALDNEGLYQSSEILYGSIPMTNTIRAANQFDFDDKFIKLVLPLLAFSTFSYTYYSDMTSNNFINIKTILNIQNRYIELAWRYLLYKYDHKQAVRFFINLISCLFSVNDAIVAAYEFQLYKDTMNSFIKTTVETLKICD